jgi:hypothetical protein
MSRTIVVIASILLLFSGTVCAQKPCPAKTIDDCPEKGCGSWDPEFDQKKNLTADPKSQNPKRMTLDEIRALPYPEHWSLGKNRAELENLGEGTLVQVTAYLIKVNYGDLSSANCKLVERWAVNDILILVSQEDLNRKPVSPKRILREKKAKKEFDVREALSVTAEITARVRLQRTKEENKSIVSNWLKEKLDALIKNSRNGKFVRITGLLLLDTEHIYTPQQRSTDWQISPVLKIEICEKGDTCVADADWTKLEDILIKTRKPLPPPQTGPRIPDR